MRAEELLPDDTDEARFGTTTVRKGTIGAFLVNARVWLDASRSESERADAERDMRDAVPQLRALGMLDLFDAREERLRALIADA